MTRTEAPLCWFVDHEMRTLDANSILVWMAVYSANVTYDCHIEKASLFERLHWLAPSTICLAIETLAQRELMTVTPVEGETLYEAIEPSMRYEL